MKELEDLKKFRTVALMIGVLLVLFIFLMTKIVPIIQDYVKTYEEHSNAVIKLDEQKTTLENMKKKIEMEKEVAQRNIESMEKQFYKPAEQGLDVESTATLQFAEITELLRMNSIKTRSISYEYNPQDDNFVKNVSEDYSATRLRAEMLGSYKDFENFLKDLYKHEHFLDICKIEVVPYKKDKKILIINFELKLYVKK